MLDQRETFARWRGLDSKLSRRLIKAIGAFFEAIEWCEKGGGYLKTSFNMLYMKQSMTDHKVLNTELQGKQW